MDVLVILAFIQAHWTSISVVALAFPVLGDLLKKKAFQMALLLCLDLVRKVAIEELSGPEKRKKVIDELYAKLPLWAKKLVTVDEAEQAAEKAYMLLRGELKAAEKDAVQVDEGK